MNMLVVFQATTLDCNSTLGQGQPGLITSIFGICMNHAPGAGSIRRMTWKKRRRENIAGKKTEGKGERETTAVGNTSTTITRKEVDYEQTQLHVLLHYWLLRSNILLG